MKPKSTRRRKSRQRTADVKLVGQESDLAQIQQSSFHEFGCKPTPTVNNPKEFAQPFLNHAYSTTRPSFSSQSDYLQQYNYQPIASLYSPYFQTSQAPQPLLPMRSSCTPFYSIPSELSTLENVSKKVDLLLESSAHSSSSSESTFLKQPKIQQTSTPSRSNEEMTTLFPLPQTQPQRELLSMSTLSKPLAPLGVFWDIENCSVPKGKSALSVVHYIRERFLAGYTEAEFICVCDIRKESPQIIQELNDAQVSVVHVSGNSKNAADDKLRQAMRRYADVYTMAGQHGLFNRNQPPSILLISGDINFSTDLSDLRFRKRLYVILLHNKHAPVALLACSHEHFDFHTLLEDLPGRTTWTTLAKKHYVDDKTDLPMKGGHTPMDVVVTDLPCIRNVNKLKNRLNKLCDNCGGKVISVQGQFAVLRFPNKEAALRASKRMTGEDVFGSKIRVIYSSQMEFKLPSSNSIEIQQPQGLYQIKKLDLTVNQNPSLVSYNKDLVSGASSSLVSSLQSEQPLKLGLSVPQKIVSVPVLLSHSSASNSSSLKTSSRDSSPVSEFVSFNNMAGCLDNLTLKKEVASVLRDVPNQALPLFKFREMFEKRYRRSISSSDLYKMRDVVSISEGSATNLSNGRIITLSSEWKTNDDDRVDIYCLAHPPQSQATSASHLGWAEKELGALLPNVMIEFKVFSANLYSLLESHNGGFPLLSFLDCYESEFTALQKVQDGEGVPLEHLISCVPGVEVIVGQNGMKRAQLIVNRDTEVIHPLGAQLLQLSRELVDLLKTFPRCAIPFAKLIPAYHHHFGRQCRVADYGHVSLLALLQTMPLTIQILGDTQNRVVTLCHRAQMKRFTTDVLRVLKAQSGLKKQVSLEEFPDAYSQLFSKPFVAEDYGLSYLSDLVTELAENTSLVTLVNDDCGDMYVAIPKRGQTISEVQNMRVFATEVVDMLKFSVRCEIPFSKFIPSYHHHFGRQCRVSSYGFSKLLELLEAIPDVVEVINPVKETDERIIRLTAKEQLKVIGDQIWRLVNKRLENDVETYVLELEQLFATEHGYVLKPELCGAVDLEDLCAAKLNDILKVRNNGKIELLERSQVDQLAEEVAHLAGLSESRSQNYQSRGRPSNYRSTVKGKFSSFGHAGQSYYNSHWENTCPKLQNIQPLTILSPSLSSPTFSRPEDSTMFTFDGPAQPMSSSFYDMVLRDSSSPSVSPTVLWTYHPVMYSPPTSPPTSNMMMPTFTFNGSHGPWSNSPPSPGLMSSGCFEPPPPLQK